MWSPLSLSSSSSSSAPSPDQTQFKRPWPDDSAYFILCFLLISSFVLQNEKLKRNTNVVSIGDTYTCNSLQFYADIWRACVHLCWHHDSFLGQIVEKYAKYEIIRTPRVSECLAHGYNSRRTRPNSRLMVADLQALNERIQTTMKIIINDVSNQVQWVQP